MDWSWAVEGVTDSIPRVTGPECINYMPDYRRWIEAICISLLSFTILYWKVKRLKPIVVSQPAKCQHTTVRLILMIIMTLIFGIEMGFKLANKSVIFILNPCHIQTLLQIYLLAAKPSKTTIALFRIQMNNLNGPFLAFLFPDVDCRTLPFEQATYWIQHAMLYIIPAYILKSDSYQIEHMKDFNWVTIGMAILILYHFIILNAVSILSGINLNHMLCAAVTDPFQGENYRIAAVLHESILCPILNKLTVFIFCNKIYRQDDFKSQSIKSTVDDTACYNDYLQLENVNKCQTSQLPDDQLVRAPSSNLKLRQHLTDRENNTHDTWKSYNLQQVQENRLIASLPSDSPMATTKID